MIDGQLDLLDELQALAESQQPGHHSGDLEEQRSRCEKGEWRTGRGD